MTKLSFPFTEEKIRALKSGGEVLVTGTLFIWDAIRGGKFLKGDS